MPVCPGPSGCCAGCTLTVITNWCAANDHCVAPGAITITVRFTNSVGPILASVTADANGRAVFDIPSTGPYHISSSTTDTGYTGSSFVETITVNLPGENCSPATTLAAIFPNELFLTDTTLGLTTTLLPSGSLPLVGTGSRNLYIGSNTYSFPGSCAGACPARTVTLYYRFLPCSSTPGQFNEMDVFFYSVDNNDLPRHNVCPDDAGSATPQFGAGGCFNPIGVGPTLATCYPVNLVCSIPLFGEDDITGVRDAVTNLYQCCVAPGIACPIPFTITQ